MARHIPSPKLRQFAESDATRRKRLEEISLGTILVPLTIDGACSISKCTIRRCRRLGGLVRVGAFWRAKNFLRIWCRSWGCGELCAELRAKNNNLFLQAGRSRHAHIRRLGSSASATSRRCIVDAGLGIGANILQANSAGAFPPDAAAVLSAPQGLRAAL